MRKTSDIALLLGSRGRGRSRSGFGRSGFGKTLRGMWETWFGRSHWRDERPSRSVLVPGWLAAIGVLAAFAGGYLAGDRFGVGPGDARTGLDTRPNAPAMLFGDTEPLADHAFLVAMYPDLPESEARGQANALARWLVGRGLDRTQPYLLPQQNVWTVAVYYANETEQTATRAKLQALTDVPDRTFNEWRAKRQNAQEEWPRTWPTR